jgi:hypothetical protein
MKSRHKKILKLKRKLKSYLNLKTVLVSVKKSKIFKR